VCIPSTRCIGTFCREKGRGRYGKNCEREGSYERRGSCERGALEMGGVREEKRREVRERG